MTERTTSRPNPANRAIEAAGFDLWLLAPVLFLCGLGLVMVTSASGSLAEVRYQDSYYLLKKQALALGLGLTALTACRFVSTSLYRHLTYPLLAVVFALLIMLLLPGFGGTMVGGERSWFRLGRFSFQPSELAKIGLIVYLAYSMAKKREKMGRFAIGMLPHLIIGGGLVGLTVLQRDLGMSAILFLLLMSTLFLGGARIGQLAWLSTAVLVLAGSLFSLAPERLQGRLRAFPDPYIDPLGLGYQMIHSFQAFGTGGLFGVGLGQGHQKLGYLPEPHTDFILAILGEELGFVGVTAVIALFLLIGYRGLYWAIRAQDPFRRYLAGGLTLVIVLQAMVNMGVVLGLIPTTGVTLPFISYGGTSLIVNLLAAGILLRLTVEIRRA